MQNEYIEILQQKLKYEKKLQKLVTDSRREVTDDLSVEYAFDRNSVKLMFYKNKGGKGFTYYLPHEKIYLLIESLSLMIDNK